MFVANVFSFYSFHFYCTAPTIAAVWPSVGPTAGGTALTIIGTSFGVGDATTVTLNNNPCVVQSVNATQIVCLSPAGSGAGLPLVVTVKSQSSNAYAWSYSPPTIISLLPPTGLSNGGYNLTLYGTDFGDASASVIAIMGGMQTPLLFRNQTMAVLTVPSGVGSLDLRLMVNLQQSAIATFVYIPPHIDSLSPTTGDTAGGTTLQISGYSFGATAGVVYLGSTGTVCPVTGMCALLRHSLHTARCLPSLHAAVTNARLFLKQCLNALSLSPLLQGRAGHTQASSVSCLRVQGRI